MTRAEQLRKGKAAERQRKKDAGLVRLELWVKPEQIEAAKKAIADLANSCGGD